MDFFNLLYYNTVDRKSIGRVEILSAVHTHKNIFCKTRCSIVQKLSIKRSAKVIVGLIDLERHTARDKQVIWVLENLSAAHTFDYILLRIKPHLTSNEDLSVWPYIQDSGNWVNFSNPQLHLSFSKSTKILYLGF